MSGSSFGFGLFELKGTVGDNKYSPIYIYTNSLNEDISLRFFDSCPKYINATSDTDRIDHKQLYLDKHIGGVIERVSKKLGIPPNTWKLTQTDVNMMYKGCAFDIVVNNITRDKFCSLFTQQDFDIFEYANDLDDYYSHSYGLEIAHQMSCPLLNDMMDTMESIINGTEKHQKAFLRFAHAETVMPFIALLGLFKDSKPMTWDSSDTVIENRQWKTSHVSPMSANVAFLLYKCADGYRVRLQHNEEEHMFPGCDEVFCPYDKVVELYHHVLDERCAFNERCGNNLLTTCNNVVGSTTTTTTSNGIDSFWVVLMAIGIIIVIDVVILSLFMKRKNEDAIVKKGYKSLLGKS